MLKNGDEKESGVVRKAKQIYIPILSLAAGKKPAVVGISFILICVALFMIPRLGTEFVPIMDEGAFDMDVAMMPGVSLATANQIVDTIEKKLMQFPELKTVVSKTGQTGIALEARGVDKTGFLGAL